MTKTRPAKRRGTFDDSLTSRCIENATNSVSAGRPIKAIRTSGLLRSPAPCRHLSRLTAKSDRKIGLGAAGPRVAFSQNGSRSWHRQHSIIRISETSAYLDSAIRAAAVMPRLVLPQLNGIPEDVRAGPQNLRGPLPGTKYVDHRCPLRFILRGPPAPTLAARPVARWRAGVTGRWPTISFLTAKSSGPGADVTVMIRDNERPPAAETAATTPTQLPTCCNKLPGNNWPNALYDGKPNDSLRPPSLRDH